MSLETHALLMKDSVPGPEAWQRAIDELGFGLTIDPEFTPLESSGFRPCTIAGRESGFEISYDGVGELVGTYPRVAELLGGHDACISFYWTRMADCACVMIACAALVKSFGAVVYDPQGGAVCDLETLLGEARRALDEL